MITPTARRLSSGPQSAGDRGWDRFQSQCFRARQNSHQCPAAYMLSQPLLQAPSQPKFCNRPQSRASLVISEKSPSPVREPPSSRPHPTVCVASSSAGPKDKGKAKLVQDDELVVAAVIEDSRSLFIEPDPNLFPTLGLSGELNLGNTQFIFDNSINEFVPLPPPSTLYPLSYPLNQAFNPLHELFEPHLTNSQAHLHPHTNDSLEAFVAANIIPSPVTPSTSLPHASPPNEDISGIASFMDQLRLKRQADDTTVDTDPKCKRAKFRSISSFDMALSLAPSSDLYLPNLDNDGPPLSGRRTRGTSNTGVTRTRGKVRGTRGRGRGGRRSASSATPIPQDLSVASEIPVSNVQRDAFLRETLATTEGLFAVQLILAENSHSSTPPLDLNVSSFLSMSHNPPSSITELEGLPRTQERDQQHIPSEFLSENVMYPPPLLAPESATIAEPTSPTDHDHPLDQGTGGWPDAATGPT